MTQLRPGRVFGLATGCVWLAGGTATAFFPPLPLGNGPVTVITPPPSLPTAPDGHITVPPVPAPPFTPPPPRPVVVPQDTPNPPHVHTTPEPATMVSALAGLAVVGAAARRRKR